MVEDNEKENQKKSYTNKYQNQIDFSYSYKLVCVDDQFSKPFTIYLGKDAVYNFLNIMTRETKYCSDVIKKHFNKKLMMTKEDNEKLRIQLNVGSVIMIIQILMLK